MKFIFDSLGELDEFVQYLGRARRVGMPPEMSATYGEAAAPGDSAPVPDAHLTPEQRAASQADLDAEALAALRDKLDMGASPSAEPDPPKRKRRTKAEMEADKAAAEAAAEAAANAPAETNAPTDAQAVAAMSPLAGANPFDASTSNAPAATAALNEAPAGTTGTLSALGTTVEERVLTLEAGAVAQAAKADATPDTRGLEPYLSDPADYIALRVAEMGGAFDAREHMKKCVEFIGALGKARYDEAFDLAGTSRSVATYTPADCAKHIAALEYLQLSGKGA